MSSSATPTSTLRLQLSFYTSLARSLLSLVFARLYRPCTFPARDLNNQNAIVTGANSGIGLSIATSLARQGATVYLACRNPQNFNAAVDHVVTNAPTTREKVHCLEVDVGNFDSVKGFCKRWEDENKGSKIDILVHNAGTAGGVGMRGNDENGLNKMYKTNFLGSFLMTCLLERQLAENARVVFTSSTGHYAGKLDIEAQDRKTGDATVETVSAKLGGNSDAPEYSKSKAYQVVFAKLLQQRFDRDEDRNRTAHSFTPGFTSTAIFSKYVVEWRTWFTNPLFAILKATEKYVAVDTDDGARTGAWLASTDGLEGGGYWEWMKRRTSLADVTGEGKLEALWRMWERDAGVEWERY